MATRDRASTRDRDRAAELQRQAAVVDAVARHNEAEAERLAAIAAAEPQLDWFQVPQADPILTRPARRR